MELLFLDLIRDELEQTEALLKERPPGQHEEIGNAIEHLIGGGGKRLRPAVAFLSSHLCGADLDRTVFAAAAVEMLHTATLVHDDLVDGSLMRRGVETLNARWTPGATVLTGDYAFARSSSLIAQTDNPLLVRRFAETLMVICDGEICQMFDGRFKWVSRQEYETRIYAKTASLFVFSAQVGAILASVKQKKRQALETYGKCLGMAFQIVDDVLDFVSDEETMGKPAGSDLRHGLVTLPVLFLLDEHPDHPAFLRALENPSTEAVHETVQAVIGSNAIDQALQVAQEYVDQGVQALAIFDETPYREALIQLAQFTSNRRF